MGIGTSIFLLAVGAILAFAVTDAISGVDLTVVGYILMAAGVLGLLISMLVANRAPRDRVITRERDVL
jgi:cation transporter-like permease